MISISENAGKQTGTYSAPSGVEYLTHSPLWVMMPGRPSFWWGAGVCGISPFRETGTFTTLVPLMPITELADRL